MTFTNRMTSIHIKDTYKMTGIHIKDTYRMTSIHIKDIQNDLHSHGRTNTEFQIS
jgi:L-ribulose-5-phosphate 3-epimerase UlaE